jgi:lantibiotic modifying enzyme
LNRLAWQPILQGSIAERAYDAVLSIADALRKPSRSWDLRRADRPCLSSGYAGLALFYAYLACVTQRESDQQTSRRYLKSALDSVLAGKVLSASLYGGVSGVAWTAQHLQQHGIECELEGFQDSVEDALGRTLKHWPRAAPFDLVEGLAGVGVYFLERLPSRKAELFLTRIVTLLEKFAEHTDEGITWRTSPESLPAWQAKLAPLGYYNLGLAHGIPGIIALLAEIVASGIKGKRAERLLDGTVAWLRNKKLPSDSRSAFTRWLLPRPPQDYLPATRVAWCYGDLGIAVALLQAGRCVGEASWRKEALELAHRTSSRRSKEDAQVTDAGFCHGSAGNGHLFNRLFHATGDLPCREAALYWFRQTLSYRQGRGRKGIGGYLAWMGDPRSKLQGGRGWVQDPGILMGAAGIGLALLSAVRPVEPSWDRVALATIRRGLS